MKRFSWFVEDMTTRSRHVAPTMGKARTLAKEISLRTGHVVAIVAVDERNGQHHPQGAYYGRSWREGEHHYSSHDPNKGRRTMKKTRAAWWYLQHNAPGEDWHRLVISKSRDKQDVIRHMRRLVKQHGDPSAYFISRYMNPGGTSHSPRRSKFERCVRKVKKKGSAVNPWAVCNASVRRSPMRESKRTKRYPGGITLVWSVPNQRWFVVWGKDSLLATASTRKEAESYIRSISSPHSSRSPLRSRHARRNPEIKDERSSKHTPYGFVIARDTFMSGWGGASGGVSYYAMAVDNAHEQATVTRNFRDRHEFKNVRFVRKLPRVGPSDHLSVADRGTAPRYFEPHRPFRR